jgi:restriction endonuclease S subunit
MPAEKIPSWIERLVIPSLNEIKGELKAINTRIDSVEAQISSLRNETKAEITSLRHETKAEIEGLRKEMLSRFETTDNKIDSLRNETKMEIASLRTEMTVRLDSLEKRIPVIEKIAVLELKIAEMEKRLAAA